MDLILTRKQFRKDGVFGEIRDQKDQLVAVTLEHAFLKADGTFGAVIPEGTFSCVRGEHYLHGMKDPFTTFEVSGVDGHVGLLFHWGNYNRDSEGCILLGEQVQTIGGRPWMIYNSRAAFKKFMDLQSELLIFQLLVIG